MYSGGNIMRINNTLLINVLLILLSSCNKVPTTEPTVEPTSVPTVEPSEEIYYLDGLASNLFVTEVPENIVCTYREGADRYTAYAYTQKDGIVYENIDCVIPNVYDDGIHGLKRVDSFSCEDADHSGYFNKLIISEGIEDISKIIDHIDAREIYYPSTIKWMNFVSGWQKRDVETEYRYYNGTVEQFNKVEGLDYSSGGLGFLEDTPWKYPFICLDGIAYFDVYGLVPIS